MLLRFFYRACRFRSFSAFLFAVAVAVAVAQILIFSAFKASRAPQAEMAEEARMSERSEFRAVPFPARSTGHRCTASASVRRQRFWLLFPRQK
ncbi:hypothetical protein [Pseudoxanthomonas sp.]|uniref:hypothetical protein n=1 Tax=Pseudoxanthomonas sp. TaxID=1871049 RepID=UPI002618F5BB|nr:hypothetical protein [Pseudoxanthomonas sp.]WDS37373.1 MAG: hypothetical protein O8I58_05690 [Pseudoxanthomonas sp.]